MRSFCTAAILLSAFVALCITAAARAQYVDTNSSCIQCHETGLRQNDFCAAVSADVWLQDDKHRRAFWLLHESDPANPERGAAKRALVTQMLGFDLAEAFTDQRFLRLRADQNPETMRKVATVKSCLRCHATWPKEVDAEFVHEPPVPLELGVSCQACHGPGERWDPPHRLAAWRAVTPEAKAALGFFDCRSSAAKATLCASCHVGSIADGKFVKHEWYAAGHPPLPGFELASFEAQMPRHWTSLREKGDFAFRTATPHDDGGQIARQIESLKRSGVPADAIKSSYLEANYPEAVARGHDPGADMAAARDVVVGGVVVLEMYARLLGHYAADAARGDAAWPELAVYDCGACHHELRGGAIRPGRRHAPGRPPLATWTTALANLTAFHAAAYDERAAGDRWLLVQTRLEQLEQATTERPFGDPAAMQAAAESLAEAVSGLRNDALLVRFDARAAQQILRVLTSGETFETRDFASARQAAWAIRAIALELEQPQADQRFDVRAGDPLALLLPAGPNRSVMENLHGWLPAAAKYDAEWFRGELNVVEASLERHPIDLDH